MKRWLSILGGRYLGLTHELGGMLILLGQMLKNMVLLRFDWLELAKNFYKVGVKSFPIVVATAILVGAIMVIQSGQMVAEYDAFGLVGWGAGYATLREVGPIMIGLMFSGRVGANNTAELGTMKVTEQVDALRALAINPTNYLLVPRFIAIVVMMFLLTVIGDATALAGGAVTAKLLLNLDMRLFYSSLTEYIYLWDLFNGLIKAFTFGVAIAIVSNYYGMSTSGGAVGVGRSVNNSVVGSAISIFVLDYFLASILK